MQTLARPVRYVPSSSKWGAVSRGLEARSGPNSGWLVGHCPGSGRPGPFPGAGRSSSIDGRFSWRSGDPQTATKTDRDNDGTALVHNL